MIKRIIVILSMLLIVIGGLVGYQWFMYEKVIKKTDIVQDKNLEIVASMVHMDGKLTVTQKVSNFRQPSFLIKIPPNSDSFKCLLPNKKECKIVDESSFQRLKVGSVSTVTFTYSIPINRYEKSKWFGYGLVPFFKDDQQGIPANYSVMLAEKEDKSVTWIAAAFSEAKVIKETLSYFTWMQKDASVFPLYMTKATVQKIGKYEPRLSIYKFKNSNRDFTFFSKWIKELPGETGLSIVQTNEEQVHISPYLLVIPKSMENKKIEELVIQSYLLNTKPPKTNEIKWVWNVLPLFVLNRPVGQGKEHDMSKDLVENLQIETRKVFAEWLLKPNVKSEKVSTSILDEQLSTVSKLKTTFFTSNENSKAKIVPLYYLDNREVFNGTKHINYAWNVIDRNNNLHFPFVQTMESLGFDVYSFPKDQMYVIKKDENSWVFYLNKPSYSYNKKEYSLNNRPLELIGNELYISEESIEGILKIDVIKRDDIIFLK